MKTISFLLLLFPLLSFAVPGKIDRISDYYVQYQPDSTVGPTEGKLQIVCRFFSDYPEMPHELHYGLNGSSETIALNQNSEFTLHPVPGNYACQFYYSSLFREIEIDSVEVKPGMLTLVTLNFMQNYEDRPVKKPVIYLYPEATTDVSVQLHPAGKLSFTYPVLTDTWQFTAQADGQLIFDQQTVPYLFWESEQPMRNLFGPAQEGFFVKGPETIAFLEEKLTGMGFNDREKTDFITFWGPQLAEHPANLVTFQWNETCNAYATLDITPRPDHVNRVYLLWLPAATTTPVSITPQVLPVFNRDGFDVLEWGGIELIQENIVVTSTH